MVEVTQLKPCPFCGEQIIRDATPNGLAEHPDYENGCPASDWLVTPKKWNQRPSTPASGVVVAWRYVRKPEEWPPANPVVQTTRWHDNDPARQFWIEEALYAAHAYPAADLVEAAKDMAAALQELVGKDLCGYVNPDNWKRETEYYRPVISWAMRHRARAAFSRYAKGGA